jgi:hypothetical protein
MSYVYLNYVEKSIEESPNLNYKMCNIAGQGCQSTSLGSVEGPFPNPNFCLFSQFTGEKFIIQPARKPQNIF